MSFKLSRRNFVSSMVSGAVALSISPGSWAQYGPISGKILLRYNENPYGPSKKGLQAGAEAAAVGAYYPGSIERDLPALIAERNGLSLENMVLSSGSNEALQAAMLAYGGRGRVVMPTVTYTEHVSYARRLGVEISWVPLAGDMSIDLDALEAAVDDSVSMVYVCNPNNPTGMTLDGDRLRAFCRSVGKKAVVLVDEAYNEVTDDPEYTSVVDLVREGENVLVMRTFSKLFGMAGYRIGYGMAHPEIARRVNNHIMAWPNGVGLATAFASYQDEEFIAFSRGKIVEGRDMVTATFRRHHIEPLPSQTNFVFADIGMDARAFAASMADRNILIRGGMAGQANFVRVSMGRLEDLETFNQVFGEVYAAANT
jgi:histidinol-phosphate aminotransferase